MFVFALTSAIPAQETNFDPVIVTKVVPEEYPVVGVTLRSSVLDSRPGNHSSGWQKMYLWNEIHDIS